MKLRKAFIILSVLVLAVVGLFLYKSLAPLKTDGEVIVRADSTNALRITVEFQLQNKASVYIRYWIDSDEKRAFFSRVSGNNFKHSIKLVGLQENSHYSFKIIEGKGRFAKETDEFNFSTTAMPKAMLRMKWTVKPAKPFAGYILSQRPRVKKSEGYVYLMDSTGKAVWYNKVPGLPKLSFWTKRNTILLLSGNPQQERSAGDHILEYDIDGDELLNLDLKKGSIPIEAHHEIQYTPDGSLLTLIYDRRTFDLSSKGDKRGQEIKADAIVRLSTKGEILWKWSVFDVMDPIKSTYSYDSLGEWGHANTVSIDRDGHYLISFRDWNEIWKINSSNGTLIWKLGEKGDFKMPENFIFSGQHSIHINPRGEYMMFDNGVKNKRSRVLSFTLDETAKTVEVKMNILLPPTFYSEKRGSAYFLDNEQILVCAAESSTVAIIDVEGNVLARAHTGIPDYYRAIYVHQLYPGQ